MHLSLCQQAAALYQFCHGSEKDASVYTIPSNEDTSINSNQDTMREGREGERRWDGRELHVHGDVYTCTCIRYGGIETRFSFALVHP